MRSIPTKKPRLLLKSELDRILTLDDKILSVMQPIQKRLGKEISELAELYGEGNMETPIEQLNEAFWCAYHHIGELQWLAEQIVKTKATAYEIAG